MVFCAKIRIGLHQMLIVGASLGVFPDVGAGCQLFARVQFRRFAGAGENAATASVVATTPLFIDRWVGIEGVLAALRPTSWVGRCGGKRGRSSSTSGQFSLYDRRFVSGHYANVPINTSRNHFVNLPGLVAFLYYPGSLLFLFGAACLRHGGGRV